MPFRDSPAAGDVDGRRHRGGTAWCRPAARDRHRCCDSRNSVRPSGPPSAQAMAVRSPMSMRSVTWPAALDDPLELVGQRHRRPDPALGVEADAVRRTVQPVGEDPPVVTATVRADGERGQPPAGRLGDDQRRAVRGDRPCRWGSRGRRRRRWRVVGIDPHDHAALAGLRSDVGAAVSSTTMSPRLAGTSVGQVGDGGDGLAVVAQHLRGSRWTRSAASRRGGTPALTARGRAAAAWSSHREGHGVHRLAEHVGEPHQALEPAGTLAEAETRSPAASASSGLNRSMPTRTFTKHAISVTLAGC